MQDMKAPLVITHSNVHDRGFILEWVEKFGPPKPTAEMRHVLEDQYFDAILKVKKISQLIQGE